MKHSLTIQEIQKLFSEIDSAISHALALPSQSEPQLVANLVWHIPQYLNGMMFSKGYSIDIGGVFVHQQPFVKSDDFPRSKPGYVEIGDLLLVRNEVCNGSVNDRRAILLQAKKVDNLSAKPDNENQHYLYTAWPTFEYVKSTPLLNGKERHVTGPDLYDASKYLLLSKTPKKFNLSIHSGTISIARPHGPHSCPAVTAHPSSPLLSHHVCFVSDLVDFVLGDTGKSFLSPPPKRKRGWDKVIDDLIKVTAERVTTHMNRTSGGLNPKRGVSTSSILFMNGFFSDQSTFQKDNSIDVNDFKDNRNGPPEIPESFDNDNQSGGISVLEFTIHSEGKQ